MGAAVTTSTTTTTTVTTTMKMSFSISKSDQKTTTNSEKKLFICVLYDYWHQNEYNDGYYLSGCKPKLRHLIHFDNTLIMQRQ